MPEEERTQYSAMTGQSLFYLGETDLRHRILAIAEEEGAERASYALKLLQSEGELTIASTGKDPATGRLVTQAYRVEGPVMIFLTTTAMEVDEELLEPVPRLERGRRAGADACDPRAAAHRRRRSSGILAKRARERVVKLHRDAQRLLRPLVVVNPFAEELGFLDHATRTRRDHMKYLTLIRTIALLHQYQREVKTVQEGGDVLSYIEVTRARHRRGEPALPRGPRAKPGRAAAADAPVAWSGRGAWCGTRVRGKGSQRQDYRFSRREGARGDAGGGNTQLKLHLGRLLEMEYLLGAPGQAGTRLRVRADVRRRGQGRLVLRGGAGRRRFIYDGELRGVLGETSRGSAG